MKKEVLISISGLHYGVDEEDGGTEPIEIITPASYYCRNGKHYVVYDEVMEGFPGSIKNTVKLTGDSMLEIIKSGGTNTRMVFEKDKIHMTNYQTPFGDMLVGIHTRNMEVDVQEDKIDVRIEYSLDVNQEPLSECVITVDIHSVGC